MTTDLNIEASLRENARIDNGLVVAEREHSCRSQADASSQASGYRLSDLHDEKPLQIGNLGNCLRWANAM